MIRIEGAYNTALCFCRTMDDVARQQIKMVCDQAAFAGCKLRIMPDVHAGKGCTIGTSMTIQDKIAPAMVGVDIGCGMETVILKENTLDLARLDQVIRECIPFGRQMRANPHPYSAQLALEALRCTHKVNLERARRSIGTLGGGNHFIEVDRAEDGRLYLVVHSGSRHLGTQVTNYYQEEGRRALWDGAAHQIQAVITTLKAQGRAQEIQRTILALRTEHPSDLPAELTYVEDQLFEDYIHDMKLVQRFAQLNRRAITDTILTWMGLTSADRFSTVHNYIDTDAMVLRKGCVSARAGERLLIPINMRDGSLLCIGKGNEEWNCSAPHGAGRLMSRKTARERLNMEQFRLEMAGVYTTCVLPDTLDEAPMAYKSTDEILCQIDPTAQVVEQLRPIYNFKAAE